MARKSSAPRSAPRPPFESSEQRARRSKAVLRLLRKAYPDAECALIHDGPFQLLTATILSAQCTDERVNATVPALFANYPSPQALAASRQRDVEKIIQPLGFFRSKATNIRGMARGLVERHAGEVPRDLESLVALPGVGRKTANVVLGTAFGIASGVVVDTHVKRISNLLGFTASSNPEIIERELCALLPRREWIMYSHRLIHHGRRVCIARRPRCTECPLLRECPRIGLPPLDDA
jgi:endonuclease III